MEFKKCSGCGEAKEYTREFFPVASAGKLRAKCKKCHNAVSRAWEDRRRRGEGKLIPARTCAARLERAAELKEDCDKNGQPCKVCGERKPVDTFYPSHRYRKTAMCITCSKGYAKKRHFETYEDKKQYHKDYYQKNKEYRKKWQGRYRKDNPDKLSEYRKRLHVKIKRNQSKRIKRVLGDMGLRKSDTTLKYIGCTARELVLHFERQFSPGMGWDNYGLRGWHIDHIRPCASFDFTDEKQVYICFHYSNLQPLWAEDNMAKGASWDSRGADSMLKFIDRKGG